MFEFTTTLPPSVNHLYHRTGKRVLPSKEAKLFAKVLAFDFHNQVRMQVDQWQPLEGRLAVQILFWFPDKRRRDLDNYLKATLDAVTAAGGWQDDSQIDDLHLTRGAIAETPAMRIRAETIEWHLT